MGQLVASRTAYALALAVANTMARAEILVALREPQRQLVTLLNNRAADLAQLEEITETFGNSEWGNW